MVQRLLERIGYDARHVRVPTCNGRRGHPIVLPRAIWPDVWALPRGATLRDLWRDRADVLCEMPVDSPSVLRDMDTPADYEREREALLKRMERREWRMGDADDVS